MVGRKNVSAKGTLVYMNCGKIYAVRIAHATVVASVGGVKDATTQCKTTCEEIKNYVFIYF